MSRSPRQRAAAKRRAAPNDEVDAGDGNRRAEPVQRRDSLAAEERRRDRHDDRRRADDERGVGHARLRHTADKTELVAEVADDAEPEQAPFVGAGQRLRREEHRRHRARPAARQADGREEDGRRQDQPHRIERLRRNLGEGLLDDAVVDAPDDDHQDQEGVNSAHGIAQAELQARHDRRG